MDVPNAAFHHVPVLLDECLRLLAPRPGETVLDATLGGGGHSVALADALQPSGTLIGLDRDDQAIEAARARLEPLSEHLSIILIHSDFGNMEAALDADPRTVGCFLDGAMFDLGVSSHQLDAERGFSFRRDEHLDMRMNRQSGVTAAQLLSELSERDLSRILLDYGEERWARRIAAALTARRALGKPVETTADLAEVVSRAVPRGAWPRDIHVATRTFQALRIAVNDELNQLEAGLNAAVTRLRAGGRIAIISFHSLEDRIVKRAFARWSGTEPSPSGLSPAAFLPDERKPILKLLNRKPIVATGQEIAHNPRARSAKLRGALRLATE